MNIIKTELDGIIIIEPKVFKDERGYFFESYQKERYQEAGIESNFIQDNESKSCYGVLRGLHYQLSPYTQAKLVRVIQGKVLDVAVDIRQDSPTFGKHVAIELSAENKRQLFIPRGFAHGFVILSKEAIFSYKCDNLYMPSHDRGILFNDPELGIDWKFKFEELILSAKDKVNPTFKEAEKL